MRHVYAILRSDDFLADPDVPTRVIVTVKKIVWTIERAESEVQCLNEVNAWRDCHYLWQLTRLEEEPEDLSDAECETMEAGTLPDDQGIDDG